MKRLWQALRESGLFLAIITAAALSAPVAPSNAAEPEARPALTLDNTPDVDLDKLRAECVRQGPKLELRIQYEIEIEDAPIGTPFDLKLRLMDDDEPVRDQDGRVIEVVVPLQDPIVKDVDEFDFHGRVEVDIPRERVRRLDDLRVFASVHTPGGPALDDKDCRVRVR